MFFAASKLLYFLISPLNWAVVLLLVFVFSKNPGKKKWTGLGAALIIIFFSNPLIINTLIRSWEYPAVPKNELPSTHTAVVLGGIMRSNMQPTDQIHLAESAERIVEGLIMVQSGTAEQLIISGGSGSLLHPEEKESTRLYAMISEMYHKIPDIILDSASRNTHENATEVYKILLQQNRTDEPVILITSAFHMKRSIACFEKLQIEVIPYSVDFRSQEFDWDIRWLMPEMESFSLWNLLIKEWIGMLAYKMAGYI